MKKIYLLAVLLFLNIYVSNATYVNVTCSESNAIIVVDGVGRYALPYKLRIQNSRCVNVEILKEGFKTEKRTYCNSFKGVSDAPKNDHIVLTKDKGEIEGYSVQSDLSNVDFSVEVNHKFNEDEAWKVISQIVTNYVDEITVSSKETGYLMTAWKVQTLGGNTVRTRIVVKMSNSNPLSYKIKIQSEYSEEPNTSSKNDEKFKEWDRILKKYEPAISEFQTRLGNK